MSWSGRRDGPALGERIFMWLVGALVFAFGVQLLVDIIRPLVGWIVVFSVITVAVVVAVRRNHW